MTDRHVAKQRPKHHEEEQRRELHAFCKGTAHQGRRQNGKRHLEHHEEHFRNGTLHRVNADAVKENFVKAADKEVAFGKSERVTADIPNNRNRAANCKALHHDG